MRLNKQVLCIVFRKINNQIEFLLLKRIPLRGDFWQPISGGVESADKNLLQAAFRELKEEADISKENVLSIVKDVHQYSFDKHYLTGKPINKLEEFVFGFEVNPETKVIIEKNVEKEHNEYRWVSFEKALEMLKWDDNKKGLKKLKELTNP
jgi:dATP pyrophosphohydrolase